LLVFENYLEIAAAIATISLTVTKSTLFQPLRKHWRVLRCPYCFSHWVAFVFATTISDSLFDFIIKSFALVCFASILSFFILIFIEKADHA